MPDPSLPPIDDDLIRVGADGIDLIASRDRETGRLVFPPRARDDPRFDAVALPREGRLWSWTVQRFRPKSPPYAGPDAFEPYAVGYVELGGALIVEGRLTGVAFDALAIGMAMRLVPAPFDRAGGGTRMTFAFSPVDGAVA